MTNSVAGNIIIVTDPAGLLEYLMIFKQKYSGPFAFLGELFMKPFKTIEEQISILEERGLIIEDKAYASKCLENLNYYRISGYTLTLRKNDKFYNGITFENAMQIYNFDKELKLLVLKYLEDIEIALRTHIGYVLGSQDTSDDATLSYLNADNFVSPVHHEDVMKELQGAIGDNKNEAFIKHHQTKYNGKLPVWAIVETLSFGALSRLFAALNQSIKNEICEKYYYGIRPQIIENIMEGLVVLRNICAHHSRLYNRGIPNTPRISKEDINYYISQGYQSNEIGKKLFFRLVMIDRLTDNKSFVDNLASDIEKLYEKYPFVKMSHYGIKSNWQNIMNEINKNFK